MHDDCASMSTSNQPRRVPHEFKARFDIGAVPRRRPHPQRQTPGPCHRRVPKIPGCEIQLSPQLAVGSGRRHRPIRLPSFSEEHIQSSEALIEMSQDRL
ncbi:hypothetical protein CASFOL_013205 [Castilleja foliolosa]|uniref:Uncharacterized protein n=1 Tax=Castilleja foliolosa TaxID=1961234 RepID=A0ABD3DJA8_9LAMI